MKVIVRSKQLQVGEPVRAHVERRLEFSLGRFSPQILWAKVQLMDINGPRGGEDKVCRMEVRLLPRGSVFVEDSDAELLVAVDRAADRAATAIVRALERTRDLRREPEEAIATQFPPLQPDTEPDEGSVARWPTRPGAGE
jgi:ribosome-associated translation inhibitor RaiA